MSKSYSEALETQVALLRDVQVRIDRHGHPNEIDSAVYRALRYGDTFWLSGDAVSLVHAASGQLPGDAVLTPDLIPSKQGFLLSSSVHAMVLGDDFGDEPAGLCGWLWDSADIHDGYEPRLHKGYGVVLMPLMKHSSRITCFVDHGYPWACGVSIEECARRNKSFSSSSRPATDGGNTIARLFLALCLFLQQRIITAPSTRAERGTRRRLERAGWTDEPVIRVVQLRRREAAVKDGQVPEHPWSCQWVVRGHWRQQFYPSRHTNQPRWITPYVKGPEDKPLKPPRATVFAVVR